MNNSIKVVITGITGQMGYFLAKKLIDRGDCVIGMTRYTARGDEKFADRKDLLKDLIVESGNLEDQSSIDEIVKKYKPDVFINCAAMSHVGESWKIPEATCDITGIGVLRCLEAIRKYRPKCKFIQCSSSEMFGGQEEGLINEKSPLKARSPYGAAKILGHQMVEVYRKSYNIKAYSAILYNYSSRFRSKDFFIRKITSNMGAIYRREKKTKIQLGNLDFCRDWGYCGDYADALILMANSDKADDYVISTGIKTTGRELIEKCFKYANTRIGKKWFNFTMIEENNSSFMRPNDLVYLCGDSSKIKSELGWEPKNSLDKVVKEMVDYDVFGEKSEIC